MRHLLASTDAACKPTCTRASGRSPRSFVRSCKICDWEWWCLLTSLGSAACSSFSRCTKRAACPACCHLRRFHGISHCHEQAHNSFLSIAHVPVSFVPLQALGASLQYEVAVGQNGRVWVCSGSPRTTVLVANAITASEFLNPLQIQTLVSRLVSTVQ